MNRFRKTLVVVAVLVVAGAVAAVVEPQLARPATTPPADATITVIGTGSAKAVPDQASFDFGVQTQASTATEALARNGNQAQAIVAALRKAGIDESQIQTTDVSLWPQTTNDGNEIVGYQASNSVDATVPIGEAGAVVDAAVAAGANNVDGPNLSVADQSSVYAAALKKALANAQAKAQAIAAASGVTLGAVQTVTEGGGQANPLPYEDELAPAAAAPSVKIEPGTQTSQATVTVTYATAPSQ
ncbi:MAG TPA: SIMPL domain-containing protein [Gaiellaceae bacterium]|nr:SIMPL domain-containing protein [Gaiellaceae bacterium]